MKSSVMVMDSAQRHSIDHALDGFEVAEGLEVKLFASEPMFQNPTNIDIDDRGRVYVCEAYNYRPQISNVPTKFEGDRIMILEDKNGDGVADESKVFYQGPEINAPLGICVLGNEVIVSQSPYIWKFTDTDGDDKADKKEILFQGINGIQDDHGVHALSLGPDGRFYFSMGNASKTIYDKTNKILKTIQGTPIDPEHFMQGLILRGNLNGTGFEILGQNFRNNYECAVDAYGNVWQSDNDDDGNRGTRINYIMEYGKYGYRDELTNASWQTFRTNWEDSIPLRHWHLNDPGVIPNMLQTGSGSPCGMTVYESDLIPSLTGDLLHAEALHNVLRAYHTTTSGAGKKAEIKNLLIQKDDSWFRPVDVTIAPDGSIFTADWYDPGVGGHYAGDQSKGRIYRLAPKGKNYQIPGVDYSDPEKMTKALTSPNLSTRSLAQLKLRSLGVSGQSALVGLTQSENPIYKIRALWILSSLNTGYIDSALNEKNEQIKIAGLRMARQAGQKNIIHALNTLLDQPNNSTEIWRECAIATYNLDPVNRINFWYKLAEKYTSIDRWFLEALGISGDGYWDEIIPTWISKVKNPLSNDVNKDILWRSRSKAGLPFAISIVKDITQPISERIRFLRSIDFIKSNEKNHYLVEVLEQTTDSIIGELIIRSFDPSIIEHDAKSKIALQTWLNKSKGTTYMDLVEKFNPKSESPRLLSLLKNSVDNQIKVRSTKELIKLEGLKFIKSQIELNADSLKISIIKGLGPVGSDESLNYLHSLALSKNNKVVIEESYRQLGKSWGGEEYIIKLATQNEIPKEYLSIALEGPLRAWRRPIQAKAREFLNAPEEIEKGYSIADLSAKSGNSENGKMLFSKNCSTCHMIGKEGISFGPALTEIGAKYAKPEIYQSILEPSKSINFGYEGEQIITKNGGIYVGIKVNEDNNLLTLKVVGGSQESIDKKNIKERIKLKQSLMTPNLYQNMSEQDLIDLVEYLSSTKKSI
ncbi:MAG: PVC-type heme-binding CxxCH protein [Saprospiraceae bacterium]